MKTVVVIDDDRQVREAISLTLRENGFSAIGASNGREGESILGSHPVDIVVTDIFMPEQDGLQTITAIRQRWPSINIVAISGSGADGSVVYLRCAKLMGAHHVLAKPFNAAELLTAVRDCAHGGAGRHHNKDTGIRAEGLTA